MLKQTLTLLLREGDSHINWHNGERKTPLLLAVRSAHVVVTRFLLERGASVADGLVKGDREYSVLDIAAEHLRFDLIPLLLDNGASVGCAETYTNLVENACERDQTALIVRLIQENSSLLPGLSLSSLSLCLQHAARYGCRELFDYLKVEAKRRGLRLYDVTSPDGSTLLHLCALSGEEDIALSVLATFLEKASTPFSPSPEAGSISIGDNELGAEHTNGEREPRHGNTGRGGEAGTASSVENLIVSYVRLARPHDLFSSLHVASLHGKASFTTFLLTKGADVNQTASEGQTPLMLAVRSGAHDVVEVLLQGTGFKCDVHAKTDRGQSVIDFASQRHCDNWRTMSLLLSKGCVPPARHAASLLRAAARGGLLEHLRRLVDAGLDVNSCTSSGHTALHDAALLSYIECMIYLVDHGARVSAETVRGETPLHCAASKGNVDAVRHLLEAGANPRALTIPPVSETPLHRACKRGHVGVARLILMACRNLGGKRRARKTIRVLVAKVR